MVGPVVSPIPKKAMIDATYLEPQFMATGLWSEEGGALPGGRLIGEIRGC